MVHQRHPIVARTIIEAALPRQPTSIHSLRCAGFVIPSWDELMRERPMKVFLEEDDPSHRRQKDAAVAMRNALLKKHCVLSGEPGIFHPPLSALVQVWPSTQLPWPPPVCVHEGGAWATWLPDGVLGGTDLPRGWRPRSHQRHGASTTTSILRLTNWLGAARSMIWTLTFEVDPRAADSRANPLRLNTPATARCTVVATGIEWIATPAGTIGRG